MFDVERPAINVGRNKSLVRYSRAFMLTNQDNSKTTSHRSYLPFPDANHRARYWEG